MVTGDLPISRRASLQASMSPRAIPPTGWSPNRSGGFVPGRPKSLNNLSRYSSVVAQGLLTVFCALRAFDRFRSFHSFAMIHSPSRIAAAIGINPPVKAMTPAIA